MGLFGRIIVGLIGITLGVLITLKYEWFMNTFGRLPSMEKFIGMFGGSRAFYILFGVLTVILSVLYMTGVFPGMITNLLRGAFGN